MTNSGLKPPEYTQVPNTLFDHMPLMSDAELRCTLAVVRKILGYHKDGPEPISYSQLEEATGLSRQSVITGIAAAIERGFVSRAGTGKRGVIQYVLNFGDQSISLTSRKSNRSTKKTRTGQRNRPELVNEVDTQKKVSKENSKEKDSDTPSGVSGDPPASAEPPEPTPVQESTEQPVQPHIALIDAYWAGLPGGKPIKDTYPRHVKLASAAAKEGVTPDVLTRFMRVVYDPDTEMFDYKRWHNQPIPLERLLDMLPVWLTKEAQEEQSDALIEVEFDEAFHNLSPVQAKKLNLERQLKALEEMYGKAG